MSVDTETAPVKEETETIAENIEEVEDLCGAGEKDNKENMNGTFLDDIKVEAVVGGEKAKESEGDNDAGNKDTSLERKVVILNIDKSKSNDEIEDYLFDTYSEPEYQIENFKVIRQIPFRVILTFVTKDQADRFAEAPFIKSEVIGFKNKIKKMKLEVFRSESADRKKIKIDIQNGLVVTCKGFGDEDTKETISAYMKDNHSEVSQVEIKENKEIQITFASKDNADKFVGLSYVKCKGQTIERTKVVDKTPAHKKTPANPKKEDRKRKHEESNSKEKSACLKLKGFKNSQTNFKSIQEALDRKGIKKFDIQFIQYNLEQKEAVVTLRNESVAGLALQALKKAAFFINNDKIQSEPFSYTKTSSSSPSTQQQAAGSRPGSQPRTLNKAKRLKSSENLQKNKIKGWTHY